MRSFATFLFCAIAFDAAAADTLRVGVAVPLSGPLATTGERSRIAVELAVEHLNSEGGLFDRRVEAVVVDDGCGTTKAIAAAARLVGASVDVVIGHVCSHSSLLAAGIYEIAGIPMLTPSSTHPQLTEEGRENVFRLIGRDDRQARFAASRLAAEFADQRIAVIHDGSTYGSFLASETARWLTRYGVEPVWRGDYHPSLAAYTGLLAELRSRRIDVVYAGGYGPDVGVLAREAGEAGISLRIFGGDALAMSELGAAAGAHADGITFSDRRISTDHAQAVEEAISEMSGTVGSGGLGAYAAVEIWAEAARRAGSTRLREIAKALHGGSFTSVIGRVSFDRKGDLRNGGWRWMRWSEDGPVPEMNNAGPMARQHGYTESLNALPCERDAAADRETVYEIGMSYFSGARSAHLGVACRSAAGSTRDRQWRLPQRQRIAQSTQ